MYLRVSRELTSQGLSTVESVSFLIIYIGKIINSMPLLKGNISTANQLLRANRVNFNLGHRVHIQGGAQGSGKENLQKCD